MAVEYGQSPVGRLVMGSLTEKNTTDHNNRPLPENKHHFFLGVAIPKDQAGEMMGVIYNKALADYANAPAIQQKIQMGLNGPFKWKIEDGDDPKYADKKDEAGIATCAGCYIFKFSTTLPIRAAMFDGQKTVECDPKMIERGFYVDVAYGVQANGQMDDTAGVYLNPSSVRLVGYAARIPTGPSLEQQFGAAPALPPGASSAPPAPSGGGMPAGMGNPPAQGGMPAGNPTPAPGAPGQMPAANPAPTGMPGSAPPAPAGATGMGAGMPNAGGQTQQPAGTTAYPSSQHPPHPGILGGGGGMPTG